MKKKSFNWLQKNKNYHDNFLYSVFYIINILIKY